MTELRFDNQARYPAAAWQQAHQKCMWRHKEEIGSGQVAESEWQIHDRGADEKLACLIEDGCAHM